MFIALLECFSFVSFLLIQDVPYLDVAPYMPEYYKPQNLLDFEERLPSSDSLSLHSFTSLTSTNLEWDDSAIAPSSEGQPLPLPKLFTFQKSVSGSTFTRSTELIQHVKQQLC